MKTVIIRIGFKAYEYREDGQIAHLSIDGPKPVTSEKVLKEVRDRGQRALALTAKPPIH